MREEVVEDTTQSILRSGKFLELRGRQYDSPLCSYKVDYCCPKDTTMHRTKLPSLDAKLGTKYVCLKMKSKEEVWHHLMEFL